ncbi:MAG: hypothetical protein GY818_22835 [Planctomycetaceae bacterium]|jgi:hypothetical protein|nr:hypothetical protein [Planctomycetaceae bacterium]
MDDIEVVVDWRRFLHDHTFWVGTMKVIQSGSGLGWDIMVYSQVEQDYFVDLISGYIWVSTKTRRPIGDNIFELEYFEELI